MVLKPEKEEEAEAIFRKWGLDFAIVGKTTPAKRFVVRHGGAVVADLPIKELGDEAPSMTGRMRPQRRSAVIDAATVDAARPHRRGAGKAGRHRPTSAPSAGCGSNTTTSSSAIPCSVRAAMPRWCASTTAPRALALTSDVTPRYCEADPFEGGKQAVAEAWRNLTAVGARAAGAHRQPQFRQSRAAGNHGPARRLHPRHRRGLPRARLPGRVRQCLALQRDQRPRRFCRRRPSAASAWSTTSPGR